LPISEQYFIQKSVSKGGVVQILQTAMRWTISGENHATHKPWQVTILARDAGDAAWQARNLGKGLVEHLQPDERAPDSSIRPWVSNEVLRVLVPPLMVMALVIKSTELAASRLRQLIISN